ncbi:MAG: His/Gly/Thr/Pro-type tRNA ligase C-terminal domain-containing protein, partial [Eubacteriales bacterium]|nr:His/Gly/Thr/Pro-type tRNA ligase C-terminal domain-containing protein [Eubacteriales bacterium]
TEKYNDYAFELEKKFKEAGLRVEVDGRNEKIGYKIREARNQRDPYILVVGEKEAESGTATVRSNKEGELGEMTIDSIISKLKEEIENKSC